MFLGLHVQYVFVLLEIQVLFNRMIVSGCRIRSEGGAHMDRRGWTATTTLEQGKI